MVLATRFWCPWMSPHRCSKLWQPFVDLLKWPTKKSLQIPQVVEFPLGKVNMIFKKSRFCCRVCSSCCCCCCWWWWWCWCCWLFLFLLLFLFFCLLLLLLLSSSLFAHGSSQIWLVVDLPLWKMMDFVNWDDYPVPYMKWKIKNGPNHQPVMISSEFYHIRTSMSIAISSSIATWWSDAIPPALRANISFLPAECSRTLSGARFSNSLKSSKPETVWPGPRKESLRWFPKLGDPNFNIPSCWSFLTRGNQWWKGYLHFSKHAHAFLSVRKKQIKHRQRCCT